MEDEINFISDLNQEFDQQKILGIEKDFEFKS